MKFVQEVITLLGLVASVTSARQIGGNKNSVGYTKDAQMAAVTSLPGLSSDIMSDYNIFSGYINVDGAGKRNVFYMFIESLNDPTNDPVFFWTNGGPGCSGLSGMWTEQGPFRVMSDQSVVVNPDAWVKSASGIFVEQPAGVGFSYATDRKDLQTGDAQAAADNLAFIHKWLEVFPNYQSNDFYTTSESYGGHYMPTLAQQIVIANGNKVNPVINYKGFFVGNPYTDPTENAIGMYDTWFGHSMISLPSWQNWYKECKNGAGNSIRCDAALVALNEEVGNVDPYALDFPVCEDKTLNRVFFMNRVIKESLGRPIPRVYEELYEEFGRRFHDPEYASEKRMQAIERGKAAALKAEDVPPAGSGNFPSQDYQQCASAYSTEYLNRPDVQTAIHVNRTEVHTWSECSYTLEYNRTDSEVPMEPIYQWLIENSDLRITVISGDDDSVCGTIGTQSWIWDLGYAPNHETNWQSWQLNGQVAGYLTKFDTNTNATFKFVTVHGAGHMIPQTQGPRSYQSFVNYLDGTF